MAEEEKNNNAEGKKEDAKETQRDNGPRTPSEDEREQDQGSEEIPGAKLFTPEIIMFFPAIMLDLVSLILIFFALDDFFIGDIVGILIIGGWTFFRSQTVKMTTGASQKIGKAAKLAKRMKWLRPLLFVGELIPYVGVLPCWTLLVYYELQT